MDALNEIKALSINEKKVFIIRISKALNLCPNLFGEKNPKNTASKRMRQRYEFIKAKFGEEEANQRLDISLCSFLG